MDKAEFNAELFPTMKSLGGSEVKKGQEKAEEKAVLE